MKLSAFFARFGAFLISDNHPNHPFLRIIWKAFLPCLVQIGGAVSNFVGLKNLSV